MGFSFFHDEAIHHLKPLTLNRSVEDLRVGIFTIKEKWEKRLQGELVQINSSVLPDENLIREILSLKENQALYFGEKCIAFKGEKVESIQVDSVSCVNHLWDLFLLNSEEIKRDLELISSPSQNVKIAKGVILNEEDGPIYIGNNVTILDGAMLRGPIALCDGVVVKMGAKIYGGTTIGPKCTVGGEVKNTIFQGYSNKAHDGYLGNSVIGEWCNLGANTNCSNMKNTMGEIKVWNYFTQQLENSRQIFCGVFMGDYTKTAIGTRINSGSSIGVACNVFHERFPPKFLPSFTWGDEKFEMHSLHIMNERMKKMKSEMYTQQEKKYTGSFGEKLRVEVPSCRAYLLGTSLETIRITLKKCF